MPVKLRRPKTRTTRITDEAIAAFKTCEEITAAGLHEAWEDEGGRKDEYLTAHRLLHVEFSLRPWEASPADVPDEGPCGWSGNLYADSWSRAQKLRRELLAAVRKLKKPRFLWNAASWQ
jgi:hypothetical protein